MSWEAFFVGIPLVLTGASMLAYVLAWGQTSMVCGNIGLLLAYLAIP